MDLSRCCIVPMSEQHGREICAWKNDPPYAVYNWPDWGELVEQQDQFADARIRTYQYASLINADDELCGFIQFFPMEGLTRLGLGLRPDLCGQGLGVGFVELAVAEARRRAPNQAIDLEVLDCNRRAYQVYERAGFVYEQTYERETPSGLQTFHCLVYPLGDSRRNTMN
jgi:ribosomal-protein-alanine N-acetyltransferase